MPLDRLSALRRALVQTNNAPRMKLPLKRCGRIVVSSTVEYVQRPASPEPFNIRGGQHCLALHKRYSNGPVKVSAKVKGAITASVSTTWNVAAVHPSATRPATADLAHDACLSEHDRTNGQRPPESKPPLLGAPVAPTGKCRDACQHQKNQTADIARPHDHSSLENDSRRPTRPTSNPKPTRAPDQNDVNTRTTSGTPRRAPRRGHGSANKRPPQRDTLGAPQEPVTDFPLAYIADDERTAIRGSYYKLQSTNIHMKRDHNHDQKPIQDHTFKR